MDLPETLFRPVREADFEAVTHLVGTIADGMTSLPKDTDFLRHRIDDSLRAFDPRIRKPGGETYLFVLENLKTQEIIGTSGLLSRVGGFDPFYTYTVRRHETGYKPLNIQTDLETLHLTKNHKGPTEICSLYLHRNHRSGGLGKLLSLSRFCFMKAFPERFDEEVIAELRGFIDESGHPPFWEAVGQKFFQKDYYTADILSGVGEKEFIESLMPKYPIYISLLPESARLAIGRVHEHTQPAREILLKEGFITTDEVDIFDAGPLLRAKRDSLNTWKHSRVRTLTPGTPDPTDVQKVLLANQSLDFRSLITDATLSSNESITTPLEAIDLLNLNPGDPVLCLPLS